MKNVFQLQNTKSSNETVPFLPFLISQFVKSSTHQGQIVRQKIQMTDLAKTTVYLH